MPKRPQMLRPKAVVLKEAALVPAQNLLVPPPNQFTHELSAKQAFYFAVGEVPTQPDGEWEAGTPVVLLWYDGGEYCRVADAQGLYVETAYAGLRPL